MCKNKFLKNNLYICFYNIEISEFNVSKSMIYI